MSGNIRNLKSFRLFNLSVIIPLLLLSISLAKAQGYGDRTGIGGGDNRNNSIQGRINFPSNQSGAALKVRLESPSSATLTTLSNSEGIFYFIGLYPGQYTVIIETGDEYEPVRETLSIDPEIVRVGAKTFNLMFDLRPKNSLKSKAGVISTSLAQVPKPALEQFKKALEARNKGNEKLAVEKFTEAVRLYPQFAEAYNELGILYLKTKELDKAEDSLRRTLQLNENNPTAQLNYGIVLLYQRKMFEAEKQLEKAVLADENAAAPHMYLGIALLGLNYYDYAEKEFLKAISLKDGEKLANAHRYLGGIYLNKKNYKQAADELEKYLELEPKAADADKARAIIKESREKTK